MMLGSILLFATGRLIAGAAVAVGTR
jgi:hypothetical protein